MSNLTDDFSEYRDRFGMNQLTTDGIRGVVSDNGALFTMQYLLTLLDDEDTPRLEKISEMNRILQVMNSLELYPGVSGRTPENYSWDSMDNATALVTFSMLFGARAFAQRMKTYGETIKCVGTYSDTNNQKFYKLAKVLQVMKSPSLWVQPWKWSSVQPDNFWNPTSPNMFHYQGWFGRSPGMMGNIQIAATGKTNAWNMFWLWVGQFVGCFKSTTDLDARTLPYISWQMLKLRGGIWSLSYKLWCWILIKQYPNGMRDVYSMYYKDPDHPIKRYATPYLK